MIVSSEYGTKAFGVEARFALTHLFSYLGCHLNLSDVNSAGPPTVFTRVCDFRAGLFFCQAIVATRAKTIRRQPANRFR